MKQHGHLVPYNPSIKSPTEIWFFLINSFNEKKSREINQCYSSKKILPQKNISTLLLPFLKTCSYI
jgi:hypothetical protein